MDELIKRMNDSNSFAQEFAEELAFQISTSVDLISEETDKLIELLDFAEVRETLALLMGCETFETFVEEYLANHEDEVDED